MAGSRRSYDYWKVFCLFLFHVGLLFSIPSLGFAAEYADSIVNRKESHITTFVHLLLASGLPFTNVRIPELDYCSHVTIELWEKSSGNASTQRQKDFSIRLSVSEGAHSPAVLDSNVDAVSSRYQIAKLAYLN